MQYHKFTLGDTIIEFHNNWLGVETVIVNGKVLSKKSSVLGINHDFTVMEDGRHARYVLTTKVNSNLQVALDLVRNDIVLHRDVPVHFGSLPAPPKNRAKKEGMALLQEYDLKEALSEFEKALKIEPKDPEIYFHMACAYSVLEKTPEGFESLRKAVKYRLHDTESILTHDMLAWLRIHPAFEGFVHSGFTEYDSESLKKEDGE